MNDLVCIGVFAGCLAATWGLVWACGRLMPAPIRPSGERGEGGARGGRP